MEVLLSAGVFRKPPMTFYPFGMACMQSQHADVGEVRQLHVVSFRDFQA